MKMNEVIANSLKDMGVEHVFGVIGDVNLFVVDLFVKAGGRYTAATHEANAVLMALGYAQVSAKTGVATVTCGPGLTNALTALVEGVKGQVPMVLITGDALSKFKFHPQRISHREFVLATGAGYEAPARLQDVGRDLVHAFQRAWSERKPVVFNFPAYDLQWEDAGPYQPPRLALPQRHAQEADSAELERAVGIVASAKRPIVLAGHGAVRRDQAEQVLALARRLDAPVMTTLRSKDLFRGDPLNLGVFGISGREEAVEAVTVSDCVVAFGAGLNMFTSGYGGLLEKKRVVLVTEDSRAIGRHATTDATVLGEPGAVAERMRYWLDEAEIPSSRFASEEVVSTAVAAIDRAALPDLDAAPDRPITIQEALRVVEDVVEKTRVLATDGGRFMRQPWQLMHVTEPRYFLPANLFGAIGTGIGYALGAACAEPTVPTVVIVGDGGFMLGGLAEFSTAARAQLDFIVVLCNDGGYGAEYLHFVDRNLDPGLALFDWPEFADVARDLGAQSCVVRTRADLKAMAEFLRKRNRGRPTLVDLKLDPRTMPRTF